jgi:hypothetical protein
MSTVTIDRIKAKLSCNHVQDVPAGNPVGAQVECDKCPAKKDGDQPTRRIKRFVGEPTTQPEPTPANEVDDAEQRIAELTDEHVARGQAPETAAVMAEADADAERQDAPLPEDVTPAPEADSYDVTAARDESRALKAWVQAGREGDAPDTPNLDALNRAHAAGTNGKAKRQVGGKATGTRRSTSERRALANQASKDCGGKRGAGTKVTEDELISYIAQVRIDHPESRMEDELEVAYWVEKLAVSRKRFYAAWGRHLTGKADPTEG